MTSPSDPKADPWRDNFVERVMMDPKTLETHPYQFRTHPPEQDAAVQGSLESIGWFDEPKLNRRTGHLYNGHERRDLAIKAGIALIPVSVYDLSEDAENKAIALFDPLTGMAGQLLDTRKTLLDQLAGREGNDAVLAILNQHRAEVAAALQGKHPRKEDPGPQLDLAGELQKKWGTARGQLWQVGPHRLIVGDSTDAGDVRRLMAGARAEMVWSDPPYGVAIGDKNKMLNAIRGGGGHAVETNLVGDTLDEAGLTAMLTKAFDHAIASCAYRAAPGTSRRRQDRCTSCLGRRSRSEGSGARRSSGSRTTPPWRRWVSTTTGARSRSSTAGSLARGIGTTEAGSRTQCGRLIGPTARRSTRR